MKFITLSFKYDANWMGSILIPIQAVQLVVDTKESTEVTYIVGGGSNVEIKRVAVNESLDYIVRMLNSDS